MNKIFLLSFFVVFLIGQAECKSKDEKPRIIVTSDGEIDDECSMMRFMLYANQWDIEGIVTSSSHYHWQGHSWAVNGLIRKELYENLIKETADLIRQVLKLN